MLDPASGIAAASIDAAELRRAAGQGAADISIQVPALSGAKGYRISIPAAALTDGKAALEIRTAVGIATLPAEMLKGYGNLASGTVELEIARIQGVSSQTGVRIALSADGKSLLWRGKLQAVGVKLPYSASVEESAHPQRVTVRLTDERGIAAAVPTARYRAGAGSVEFQTSLLGDFRIEYVVKEFKDTARLTWAAEAIDALAAKGVIKGTGAELFTPSANVRRADFVLMLVRALGLRGEAAASFTDVPAGSYYEEEAAIAKSLGIATGREDGSFDPMAPITRQEMMALAFRALKLAGKPVPPAAAELDGYADRSLVAAYAAEAAAALVQAGLLRGDGSGLNPAGLTTRAEAAVLIYRLYGWMD